jgi:hypothetical protein
VYIVGPVKGYAHVKLLTKKTCLPSLANRQEKTTHNRPVCVPGLTALDKIDVSGRRLLFKSFNGIGECNNSINGIGKPGNNINRKW